MRKKEKKKAEWALVREGMSEGERARERGWKRASESVCVSQSVWPVEVRTSEEESVEMKRRAPAKIGQARLACFGLALAGP